MGRLEDTLVEQEYCEEAKCEVMGCKNYAVFFTAHGARCSGHFTSFNQITNISDLEQFNCFDHGLPLPPGILARSLFTR
jgi:hypothetical protein